MVNNDMTSKRRDVDPLYMIPICFSTTHDGQISVGCIMIDTLWLKTPREKREDTRDEDVIYYPTGIVEDLDKAREVFHNTHTVAKDVYDPRHIVYIYKKPPPLYQSFMDVKSSLWKDVFEDHYKFWLFVTISTFVALMG